MCCYTHNLHRDEKKCSCTVVFKWSGDNEFEVGKLKIRIIEGRIIDVLLFWFYRNTILKIPKFDTGVKTTL